MADLVPFDDWNETLIHAVDQGDVARARAALAAGAVANGLAKSGRPLILEAAYCGDEAMFHALIDHGADITVRGPKNTTILHELAMGDSRDDAVRARMTQFVVKSKLVDVNAEDERKTTPVAFAANSDLSQVIQVLHRAGADINRTDFDGVSPAHLAVGRQNLTSFLKLSFLGAHMDKASRHSDAPQDMLTGALVGVHNFYQDMPEPDFQKNRLTRSEVMGADDAPTLLDHPSAMRRIDEVFAKLDAAGEALTLEDWCAPLSNSRVSHLEFAAACGVFDRVVRQLAEQGELLRPSDLQHEDGGPTPLASGLTNSFVVDGLFQKEIWEGRSSREVRALYDALPDAARKQVDNLHQLVLALDKAARLERAR